MNRSGKLKTIWRGLGVVLLVAVAGVFFYAHALLADLPDPAELATAGQIPSVRIEARDGRLLYEAMDAQSGRQAILPLEQIPLALQQATIAVEDRHFYENEGVDATGIVRALWINIRGRDVVLYHRGYCRNWRASRCCTIRWCRSHGGRHCGYA